MSALSTRCPKCNGEMVQGFTIDTDGSTRKVGTWVEGEPEKTFMASCMSGCLKVYAMTSSGLSPRKVLRSIAEASITSMV